MSFQSTVTPARRLHDAPVVYLYDGSFPGFLCCVFESFVQHEIPFAVFTPQREVPTLYPVREIETDLARAKRVHASFQPKLGADAARLTVRCFLSGREDKELLLLRFCIWGMPWGRGSPSGWGIRMLHRFMRWTRAWPGSRISSRALCVLRSTAVCCAV